MKRVYAPFLKVLDPKRLSLKHACLFIFFPLLCISAMFLLSLRFWAKFFTTATAIIISMVTQWKCFAAFEAGQQAKAGGRGARQARGFSFNFQLFSSHQLFIHVLSPSLTESQITSKMESGECHFSCQSSSINKKGKNRKSWCLVWKGRQCCLSCKPFCVYQWQSEEKCMFSVEVDVPSYLRTAH